MVKGALEGESGAPGSSPGSITDFRQTHETGGLGLDSLMFFPALKFDGSGRVVVSLLTCDPGWEIVIQCLSHTPSPAVLKLWLS